MLKRIKLCPSSDLLLRLVSVPESVSVIQKSRIRLHIAFCSACSCKLASLQKSWQSCFSKELDVTDSVIRVFSRIQNDSTLVLKGWKLGSGRERVRSMEERLYLIFRWGLVAGSFVFIIFVLDSSDSAQRNLDLEEKMLSKIHMEEDNRTRIHYVEPENFQQAEFETVSYEMD